MQYNPKTFIQGFRLQNLYTYYHNFFASGASFSGQWHSFWEINVLLAGKMALTCNDEIIYLQKGDLSIIAPNVFHKFTVMKNQPVELFVMTFDAEFDFRSPVYRLSEDNMQLLRLLMKELERQYPDNSCVDSKKQASQLTKTLLESLMLSAMTYDSTDYERYKVSDLFSRAQGYMRANLYNKLDIRTIAMYCNVSPSALKNLFKEHTGGGVMQFFMNMKLEYSRELLKAGNSIGSIAEALNFSSTAHFSAVFKRAHGISPLAYKKLNYQSKNPQ